MHSAAQLMGYEKGREQRQGDGAEQLHPAGVTRSVEGVGRWASCLVIATCILQ